MKDAFGGVLNIIFIAIFLLIVEGVLGLIVNYTKAFRMKNIVITAFEKYEAAGCTKPNTECYDKIVDEAKGIGYSKIPDLHCSRNFVNVDGYYCYYQGDSSSTKNYVYTIETQVDINIPIINKIMGLSFFKVRGDTRIIKK